MAKKRKFIVLPRNEVIFKDGLKTGKGHRKFKRAGAMWITDPAEADEIDKTYGMKGSKQVAVTTDQQYEWSANHDGADGTKMNNIHNYTFQGIDTSHFKVWVRRGGKLVRVTKNEALRKGLKVVSTSKSKPKETVKRAQGAEVKSGKS